MLFCPIYASEVIGEERPNSNEGVAEAWRFRYEDIKLGEGIYASSKGKEQCPEKEIYGPPGISMHAQIIPTAWSE